MSATLVELRNLGRFEQKLADKGLDGDVRRGLKTAGGKILSELRALTAARGIRDTGNFAGGWGTVVNGLDLVVFNAASNAEFVEHGRAPGAAMPPLGPIGEWLQRRGKSATLAFVVARSISRRGIKARPVMYAPGMLARMTLIMVREASTAFQQGLERLARQG